MLAAGPRMTPTSSARHSSPMAWPISRSSARSKLHAVAAADLQSFRTQICYNHAI